MLVLVSDSLVLWDVTAFTDFSSTFYSKCLLLKPNNAFYHNLGYAQVFCEFTPQWHSSQQINMLMACVMACVQ